MTDFVRRFKRIALVLSLLGGCTQGTGSPNSVQLDAQAVRFARLNPGMNFVTFTSFADGRLALVGGCFRLVTKQASMAIIWPETAILAQDQHTIRIEDHAARWSALIGARIRLGGKASDNIAAVDLNNNAVRDCSGPYFVASNVIRHRFIF